VSDPSDAQPAPQVNERHREEARCLHDRE
jgi:hypothetical protein